MISNKSDFDEEKAEAEDDSSHKTRADVQAYLEKFQQEPFDRKLEEVSQKLKEIKELEKRLEKTESKLVEVLGIFTAIVVTFVGTFTFSSSVLSNMDKGDIHRLIFVVLCIAVFTASILRWLFDFLLRICGKETKDSFWWWLLIIFLFLILLACDFCEYRMETYFHVLKY